MCWGPGGAVGEVGRWGGVSWPGGAQGPVASRLAMDFMILFLDSVCSRSVSQTRLLPRSQTVAQTVVNQHTTLQLSSVQPRSGTRSDRGCRVAQAGPSSPLYNSTQRTVSQRAWESSLGERTGERTDVESGRFVLVKESSLGERTLETNESEVTWNQVGSFLLKSRVFELIRSQTPHH